MAGGTTKPRAGRKAPLRRHDPAPKSATTTLRNTSKLKRRARSASLRLEGSSPRLGSDLMYPLGGRDTWPDDDILLQDVPEQEEVLDEKVPEPAVATKDCNICAETKVLTEFPQEEITELCSHEPGVCMACIQKSIRVNFSTKVWNQIHCPECHALLDYHHVHKYADEETFARYENMSLRAAVGESQDFIWCPAGCGAGQIHETGPDMPIVSCVQCGHRYCFVHQVPWHEGITCTDYDVLQNDPENFRPQMDIDNEDINRSLREVHREREEQEEADRMFAQSLFDQEEALRQALEFEREQEVEADRVEAARVEAARVEEARVEAARIEAARIEAVMIEEEARVEAARLETMRKTAARIKADEKLSSEKVGDTTQTCPGCGWAIEKKSGRDHMTCRCGHQFCYECGADCSQIRLRDNTFHKPTCSYYA